MRQRFNATYSRTYNDEYVLKMRVNLCIFFWFVESCIAVQAT